VVKWGMSMRRVFAVFAVASLVAFGVPVSAQAPAPQKWELSVENGWCEVSTGDPHKGYLILRVTPGAQQAELIVVAPTKLIRFAMAGDRDAKVTVLAGSKGFELQGVRFAGRIGGTSVLKLYDPDSDFLTALTHTPEIRIEGLPGPVTVPTRGAIVAVNGLATCGDKLLGEWGIEPIRFHGLGQPPELTSNDWLTSNDYPNSAAEFAKQGGVVARVDVDASGKPTNCATAATSGYQPLDRVVCARLMSKAKFTPAIGPDGQPTAAPVTVRVTFEMEDF
jgi:TonB family protein